MQQLVIKDGKVVALHEMHQNVRDKYPGCEVVVFARELQNDVNGDWHEDDPRTKEEKKQAYKDKRRLEYPTIADQLDMIYHDAMDGTTTWKDAITAVRTKYPKPDANEQ